ncbi:MAG: hypothetical protein D6711_16945 [Chloroflexi bacterium]|nr:MAG: hypothetical protein D6711_16945 [Chloroflexota bacterium]
MQAAQLTEQIQIRVQQHQVLLDQWLVTIDAIQLLRLDHQMRLLENEVQQLEATTYMQPSKAAGIKATLTFTLPPHQVESLLLKWVPHASGEYVVESNYPSWQPVRLSTTEITTINDGIALFDMLFGKNNASVYSEWLEQAYQAGARPQIQVVSDGQPSILQLPWTQLNNGQHPLVPCKGISLFHRLPTLDQAIPTFSKGQLRILLSTSGDVNTTYDREIIDKLVHDFPHLISVREVNNSNPARLINAIVSAQRRGYPFHIWHHHGVVMDDNGTLTFKMQGKAICLSDISKLAKEVGLFLLWSELDVNTSPQMVAEQAATISAPMLLHILQTDADSIHREFLRVFYMTSIIKPIDEGLIRAIERIYTIDPDSDLWKTVKLYTRTDTPSLIAK